MDPEDVSRKWYYARGGEKFGPLPGARILSMARSGELTSDTLVWSRGMEDWAPLEDSDLWSPEGAGTTAESAVPRAPDADEPGASFRWVGRMAWLFDVLAKEGSGVLLAAGAILAYLDIFPLSRITVGAAAAGLAGLCFLLFKTAASTLRVQSRMARRQRRLMDEVQMLAHGAGRRSTGDISRDEN